MSKEEKETSRTDGEETEGRVRKNLARSGEDAAARFLYRRGYEIVERNWECPHGEVDIIARDGDTLVFVEVKTRPRADKGFPVEGVTQTKRDRYEKIAIAFLADYGETDIDLRFDVISLVIIAPDRALIRHHINAFAA